MRKSCDEPMRTVLSTNRDTDSLSSPPPLRPWSRLHDGGIDNNARSWADSEIFSNEMYGSAMNSPENQYQIVEGWFSGATSLYDPDYIFVHDLINPGHNFYGFIDARHNFQVWF